MDATEEKPVSQDRMLVSHSLFFVVVVVFKFQIKKIYVLFILLAILEVFIKKKKVFFFLEGKMVPNNVLASKLCCYKLGCCLFMLLGFLGSLDFWADQSIVGLVWCIIS